MSNHQAGFWVALCLVVSIAGVSCGASESADEVIDGGSEFDVGNDAGIAADSGSADLQEDMGPEVFPGPHLVLSLSDGGVSFATGHFGPEYETALGTRFNLPGPCRFREPAAPPTSHKGGPEPIVVSSAAGEVTAEWNGDPRFRSYYGEGPGFRGEVVLESASFDGTTYTSDFIGSFPEDSLLLSDSPTTLAAEMPYVAWGMPETEWEYVAALLFVFDAQRAIVGTIVCVAEIEDTRLEIDLSLLPENAAGYVLNLGAVVQREVPMRPGGTASVALESSLVVQEYGL